MKDISQKYWVDREIESEKPFVSSTWKQAKKNPKYREIVESAKSLLPSKQIDSVLSLACGSCWLESELLANSDINEFIGVDFSSERFEAAKHNIASLQIQHSSNENSKMNFELIQSDVYDLKIEKKFDLIIMVQAFHHFDSPVYLLKKLHNLLNEGGHILIVGEHNYSLSQTIYRLIKHIVKYTLNYKNYSHKTHWLPGYNILFPPCLIKGDNHYGDYEYHIFAHRSSMRVKECWKLKKSFTKGFLLELEV